jgi:hypothetical protein
MGGGMAGEYPGRLEAVCARAFQNVFGEELFPSAQLKAAFNELATSYQETFGQIDCS